MKRVSFHILRVGLAITFLWIGVLILKNPEAWGGYLQPWAAGLLPIPIAQAMMGTAILDIAIGAFLLINLLPWLVASVGAVHLAVILIVSGITDITVRDIGLLAGMLALMIDSLPPSTINKIKKNMNKIFVVIIVIAIFIVGGYSLTNNKSEQVETAKPVAEEKVITYTDAGYSPSPLEINIGDTVIFKNESSQSMWPASAMHPTHKDYPTTGGCIGSAFDACKGVQQGDSWSFKFDVAGDWKYHDHLNPKKFGAIIVQQ